MTVYQKRLSEWLNLSDPVHRRAWLCWQMTGRWPTGFLSDGVWEDPGWSIAATGKDPSWGGVGKYPWAQEFERVIRVVGGVSFPGYHFVVEPVGEEFSLQVAYDEPDVVEPQTGRRWVFPDGQTEGQIVQTAFKAVLTSLEHRAREHFLYRGRPVLQPHLDMEALLAGDRHQQEIFREPKA